MRGGIVFWDDDNLKNWNSESGSFFGGKYNSNMKINFCCKIFGNKVSVVFFFFKLLFYLLVYKLLKC